MTDIFIQETINAAYDQAAEATKPDEDIAYSKQKELSGSIWSIQPSNWNRARLFWMSAQERGLLRG